MAGFLNKMSTHYVLFILYFGDIMVDYVGLYNVAEWHSRAIRWYICQSFLGALAFISYNIYSFSYYLYLIIYSHKRGF